MNSATNSVLENVPVALGPISADVIVPGSKSIANRALVCAALAEGTSVITHMAPGDDTEALRECLTALGITMRDGHDGLEITGSGGILHGGVTISARLAGTTSRFMIAVSALADSPVIVTGEEALRARPFEPLYTALQSLGAHIVSLDSTNSLPVEVSRSTLRGGRVSIRGDVSSQFLSALMLIGPLLEGGLTLEVTSPLISLPYVSMTAAVMQSFGIAGIEIDTERIVIPVGTYQAQRYAIEPDASSASYPLAAVAICGGMIKIPGLKTPAIQGDIGFLNILRAMGVDVVADVDGVVVRSFGALKGVQLDLRDMSDLVPTVAALAVFADTPTEITGVGFIRLKESDRIGDLVRGLQALGCDSSESADGLLINPVPIAALKGVRLATHHDHRLAMAWSLIALRVPGISIENPEVVSKSWPQWWAVRHLMVLSTSPTNSGQ